MASNGEAAGAAGHEDAVVDLNEFTTTEHTIRISMPLILKSATTRRKTKLICTMGPKCWSEEMLGKLLDAGMNVARLNFSHGSHVDHQVVLDSLRKVCAAKNVRCAALLDTKGPEIRTSVLKDGAPIELIAGQTVIVQAVGDPGYLSFQGYKNETETRIGLSYDKLCQSVKPGSRMLLADGSITIVVQRILSPTEVEGKVLNTKKLGERKNCNLPGAHVMLPVLSAKDIEDLQNFCCANNMDYVAASFVQTGADVRFIRRILDDAGGQRVKIISKIENHAGVQNFDDILKYTDGIMVARGDLGMEIEPAKVPLAQKLMLTRCNMRGKFAIVATQMLESMIDNPQPTRAEMTDAFNAVLDGADCVMLSGETANGKYPEQSAAIMAAICVNAELGLDYDSQLVFIRDRNAGTHAISTEEATLSNVAKIAIDIVDDKYGDTSFSDKNPGNELVIVFTTSGLAANLISKYRPPCVVLVVSNNERTLRNTSSWFGQIPYKPKRFDASPATLNEIMRYALDNKLAAPGKKVIVARGVTGASADSQPLIDLMSLPSDGGPSSPGMVKSDSMAFKAAAALERVISGGGSAGANAPDRTMTMSLRSTKISVGLILEDTSKVRLTKIIATLGPASSTAPALLRLLNAGLDIARFDLIERDTAAHLERLAAFRAACEQKRQAFYARTGSYDGAPVWATMCDTAGPQVQTARLRGGTPIELVPGQDVVLQCIGSDYLNFEGYKTPQETRIGLSYGKLAQSVAPEDKILLGGGSIAIQVVTRLSPTEILGRVQVGNTLRELATVNVPGMYLDQAVLSKTDISDVITLACQNRMDYVAVSFVQTAADVQFVRAVLDENGGKDVQIIAKIESHHGLCNFDEILGEADGIMIARGDLGLEIPPEKVALAQKYIIVKCNLAGKFVITATEMLQSMVENPRPTRAEMTDVANSVIDGTDAVLLIDETAKGNFGFEAVSTMSSILMNAEVGVWAYSAHKAIRAYTPKPLSTIESVASSASQICLDTGAKLMIVLSATGYTADFVSKYKPVVPVLVVTSSPQTAARCRTHFGQFAFLVETMTDDVSLFVEVAEHMGLFKRSSSAAIVMVKGWRPSHDGECAVEATVEIVHTY